jgi:hypothetical protein
MTTTLNASTAGAGGFIATSDNSGVLALQTAGTTAITVDASQQVGIGTTPSTWGSGGRALEIGGYVLISSFTNELDLTCNAYYSGGWKYKNTDFASQYYQSSGAHYWLGAGSGTAGASVTGFNTPKMTLDSSGNLLVGTTSAISSLTERLAVKVASGTLTPISISVPSNVNRYQIEFYTPSGLAGYVLTNTLTTSYTSVSDYRLKENITPMAGALARVSQLKPVTYKWKTDGSDGQGFIAHELAEVCSDAVTGIKDAVNEDGSIKPQGVDTSFLVATLTAAIQELKAINDTQAETINALTARIVALEQA